MRLGLFGGTFDPIHLGHMQVLEQIPEFVLLDQILVMPCGVPPHGKDPMFDGRTRLRMVERALETYKGDGSLWMPSPREVARAGPSYTVDTLRLLLRGFDVDRVDLILGEEELWTFEKWREPRAILEMANIVAVENGRTPWGIDELPEWIKDGITERVVTDPPISISSTLVRHRIQAELSVRFLVPDPILEVIDEWLKT